MDQFALRAANVLVGNPPTAALLELTAGGVDLQLERPALIALTGADLGATLDDRPLPLWTSLLASRGARLRLRGRRTNWGARAYLALAGGLTLPPVLGAAATDLAGGFGGWHGRPLRAGDQIPFAALPTPLLTPLGHYWPVAQRPAYGAVPTLRFIAGPHQHCFAPKHYTALTQNEFRISATSNRIGYRLEGVRIPHLRPTSLPSLGVIPGTLQVPPDGQVILLMADAQTTGGYPVFGVVISADLPLAAQLLPGDQLRLAPIELAEAHQAAVQMQHLLASGPISDEGDPLSLHAGALP
jgi:biotin-dependent carboxylase-like uncharacterized protein